MKLIENAAAVILFSALFVTSALAANTRETVQTRIYAVPKAQALQATLSVFQDNLYTDIEFIPELGLFQAEMPVNLIMDSEGKAIARAVTQEGAGRVLGGLFGGGVAAGAASDAVAGKSQSGLQLNRVQATVEDLGNGDLKPHLARV